MRFTSIILALAVSVGGGAALANSTSDGAAQLAAQLGVDATDYSTGELAALWLAKQDGESAAVPFSAADADRPRVARAAMNMLDGGISPGRVQLAAQLGVDPANYSAGELVGLLAQMRDTE